MISVLKLAILTVLLSSFVYGCSSSDGEATETDGASGIATDVNDGEIGTDDGNSMDLAVFQNADGELICPIVGDVTNEEDATGFQDYDGVRYYFCSDGCPDTFAADPAKFAAN